MSFWASREAPGPAQSFQDWTSSPHRATQAVNPHATTPLAPVNERYASSTLQQGDGVADLEFQVKLSTQMQNSIKVSKSGKEADRELVMQLCTDGFTLQFKKLKEGKAAHKGPGWFTCSLCESTLSCDEEHAGTIRHCCLPSSSTYSTLALGQ